jgi:hypothetical protein
VLTVTTSSSISAVKTYMAYLYGYNFEWLAYYPHGDPLDFLFCQITDAVVFQDKFYLDALFSKVREAVVTMFDYSRLALLFSWTYRPDGVWKQYIRDLSISMLTEHRDEILSNPFCLQALLLYGNKPCEDLAAFPKA